MLHKRGVGLTRDVGNMEQEKVTMGYLLLGDECRASGHGDDCSVARTYCQEYGTFIRI